MTNYLEENIHEVEDKISKYCHQKRGYLFADIDIQILKLIQS